jgi:hypothetical protein
MRCGVEVAAIRADPSDDAEQVTQLLRGEHVEVEERCNGWARIRTGYDYPGWIREDALCGDSPLDLARSYLGTRYEWGGMSAAGIDCSGLVHMAFRLSGRIVPRDAWQQAAASAQVGEPEPGDLVVYGDPVEHVAFWVGDGRIVHATGRDGVGVVEEAEPEGLRRRSRRFVRL